MDEHAARHAAGAGHKTPEATIAFQMLRKNDEMLFQTPWKNPVKVLNAPVRNAEMAFHTVVTVVEIAFQMAAKKSRMAV